MEEGKANVWGTKKVVKKKIEKKRYINCLASRDEEQKVDR